VSIHLGRARIEFDGDLTTTVLPAGKVPAVPQDNDEYRARAEALGYGDDTALMSREHEIGHALLAVWLGQPYSPTLFGVATGQHWPHWHDEEAAVLALQRYARVLGVDLVRVAERRDPSPMAMVVWALLGLLLVGAPLIWAWIIGRSH
jgi:hypothetical protein